MLPVGVPHPFLSLTTTPTACEAESRGVLEKPLADSGLIEAVRSATAAAG